MTDRRSRPGQRSRGRAPALCRVGLIAVVAVGWAGALAAAPDGADDHGATGNEHAQARLERLRDLDPERDPEAYLELGRRVLGDVEGADSPELEAPVRSGIGRALRATERYREAVAELRAAADLAAATGQLDILSSSLENLARSCFRLGEFDRCLDACREALDHPGIGDDQDRSWRFLNIMAAAMLQTGDYDGAIEAASSALVGRERAGDRPAEAILLNNIGVAHMYLGDLEQALEFFQRARVIKAELGETGGVADMLANIGDIRHLQGNHEDAIDIHREALALREAEGGERRIALSHRSLAAALVDVGRFQEALDHIEIALEIERRLGLEPEIVSALAYEAEALAGLGRTDEAIASANESLELARSLGMRSREIVALDALTEALASAGRHDEALEVQSLAREIEGELLTAEIRSDFAEFQAAYDARAREREIELLRKSTELQALELRHQRVWRNSLAVGSVLLLLIAGAGWNRFLVKRREVHDRERAEAALLRSVERHRRLFERNLAGVFQAESDGTIRIANRAFASMLGYPSNADLTGKRLAELAASPDDIATFLDDIASNPEIHNRELVLVGRDGSPVSVLMNAGRVDHAPGVDRLIDGIAIDISDRNRAEEDRHQLAIQLQQSQKLESLGVLAGGIAHDFNNMLMAILSNISLAKRSSAGDDEVLRRLGEAEEVCLRATGLTQQLLTFSKGGRPIRRTAPIAGLVEEAAAFAIRGSRCTLEARSDEAVWPAEIDEGQIVQVVQNLVLNAVQAMPDGGTVTITTDNTHLAEGDVPTLEAGRYVRIEVADAGVGIPDAHIERIFDPFFTTRQNGSGLGLATAFSIVRSHGGAIVVHSEPDRGSRFAVFLPASDESRVEVDAPVEDATQGHGRLLVMDDDQAVRSAAAELLATIGFEVETAADGAETIEHYQRAMADDRPFDAVILDLTVPEGMGGRETMTRLLELDPAVRAIVSSGYSTDPVMANYREHGFSGVAVKPYRLADLARTLRRVINGRAES